MHVMWVVIIIIVISQSHLEEECEGVLILICLLLSKMLVTVNTQIHFPESRIQRYNSSNTSAMEGTPYLASY